MSAMSIYAVVEESKLEKEFEKACENPQQLDCSFTAQRLDQGLANFGFPADKAAEMREKELARIAAELEAEPLDYEPEDDDDACGFEDDYEDDGDLPELDDEDDDYDRFSDSYGFDDEDDDSDLDNWE